MIVLRIPPDAEAEPTLTALKLMALRFPGPLELMVRVGDRTLTFGPSCGYSGDSACLAAMAEFGSVLSDGTATYLPPAGSP